MFPRGLMRCGGRRLTTRRWRSTSGRRATPTTAPANGRPASAPTPIPRRCPPSRQSRQVAGPLPQWWRVWSPCPIYWQPGPEPLPRPPRSPSPPPCATTLRPPVAAPRVPTATGRRKPRRRAARPRGRSPPTRCALPPREAAGIGSPAAALTLRRHPLCVLCARRRLLVPSGGLWRRRPLRTGGTGRRRRPPPIGQQCAAPGRPLRHRPPPGGVSLNGLDEPPQREPPPNVWGLSFFFLNCRNNRVLNRTTLRGPLEFIMRYQCAL